MTSGGAVAGAASPLIPAWIAYAAPAATLATLAAALFADGVALVFAPWAALLVVYAASRVSLRASTMTLVFLLLVLDRSSDAHQQWSSPLATVGDLLNCNLDGVVPFLIGFKLTGTEVVATALMGLMLYRRMHDAGVDRRPVEQTALVLSRYLPIYVGAIMFTVATGVARGGSMHVAIWQFRSLLQVALLFLLFKAAFSTAHDYRALARIIVACALVKSGMAIWLRSWLEPMLGGEWQYSTNHGDSVLFSSAALIVLIDLVERRDRRRLAQALVTMPAIVCGIWANNRRIAWAELAMALAAVYAVSPWRGWKRHFTRWAVLAAPLMLLYAGAGWNSRNALFSPVRIARSMFDERVDGSTWWRDVENWNITMTLRESPLLGIGFGREYREWIIGGMSSEFPMYRAEPHNQVLGLALFAGPVGSVAINGLLAMGIYLAARAFRQARSVAHREISLFAIGAIIICTAQAYGDLGPYFTQYKVVLALALALAGKVAVATGAWPAVSFDRLSLRRSVRIETGAPQARR